MVLVFVVFEVMGMAEAAPLFSLCAFHGRTCDILGYQHEVAHHRHKPRYLYGNSVGSKVGWLVQIVVSAGRHRLDLDADQDEGGDEDDEEDEDDDGGGDESRRQYVL